MPGEFIQASASGPPAVHAGDSFRGNTGGAETAEEALRAAGFFPIDAPEMVPEQKQNMKSCVPDPIPYTEFRQRLEAIAARPSEFFSVVSRRLLHFLADGRYMLSKEDITAGIVGNRKRIENIITGLRKKGLLVSTEGVNGTRLYKLNVNREYSPEIINTIRMLTESNTSPKDRRIGHFLLDRLDEGFIDIADYRAMDEESKWQNDMKLCQQLGLVTRITAERYTINEKLEQGFGLLDQTQRTIASVLYETFGQETIPNFV